MILLLTATLRSTRLPLIIDLGMIYIAYRNNHNIHAWENPSHTCRGRLRSTRNSVQLKLLCSGSTCTPDSGTFSQYGLGESQIPAKSYVLMVAMRLEKLPRS